MYVKKDQPNYQSLMEDWHLSDIFHINHILVGSVILPTRTGILFFLSWTTKMKGRSTTMSFCSPNEAEKRAISTPVAAAPSVPSFDTWGQDGERRVNQEEKRTSTNELCLILLTEIGALEIPSNSAFWLKTWVIQR